MKITKKQLRRIIQEAIEPSQDIQDVRKKMGLPPAETISDDDIAKAMAEENALSHGTSLKN